MMKELLVHQRRRRRLPRRSQLRRKLLRRRRLLRRRKLQRRRSRHKQPQPHLVQQLEAWEIGSACDASSRLLRSRIFCELVMWTCNATSSLRDRLLRLVWTCCDLCSVTCEPCYWNKSEPVCYDNLNLLFWLCQHCYWPNVWMPTSYVSLAYISYLNFFILQIKHGCQPGSRNSFTITAWTIHSWNHHLGFTCNNIQVSLPNHTQN